MSFAPRPMKIWRITGSTSLVRSDKSTSCRPARRASRADLAFGLRPRARFPARRRDATPVPSAGTPCRRRIRRAPAASRPAWPHPRRRNASGIWIRMPAPSPCSGSAPVAPRCVEILEDLQPLRDDRVAFLALDMGDEAHAAGVVLVARVVQALPGRRQMLRFARSLAHVVLTACARCRPLAAAAAKDPMGRRPQGELPSSY